MVSSQSHQPVDTNPVGPHPSYIQIAKPYIFQHTVQQCLIFAGSSDAKDDSIRLQGIAWIDSVRKAMYLPVRTYNTAVVYYLKFRLVQLENIGYIDAAAAALFAACKIEDTLKKSKEILCAAHNVKLIPAEQVTPDDPMFEERSKIIIGLERLMLEASGFDFRNRYPQRLVLKIAKFYNVEKDTVGKTAYNMSMDLYRTYAPLKQTTITLAMACVELSARVHGQAVLELGAEADYKRWQTSRPEVMETLLDLLDLYTHYKSSTVVGQDHTLEHFISIRITLNQEASANQYPRYTQGPRKQVINGTKTTNGTGKSKGGRESRSLSSPLEDQPKDQRDSSNLGGVNGLTSHGKHGVKDGTVRFMLDPERARGEKRTVADFFKVEEEEYEVEVEVKRERERRRASPLARRRQVDSSYEVSPGDEYMTEDWNLSDEAPIREKPSLGEQSHAFEASRAERKSILTEKRDNMNRIHKSRPEEHKPQRTEMRTSEAEARYFHDGKSSNRW